MEILVIEGEPGMGSRAEAALTRAGHTVRRCHEGEAAFPCNGIHGEAGCPLDDGPVDVAVVVTHDPGESVHRLRTQPTVTEDGVSCALRNYIPLVVSGPEGMTPYDEYAVVTGADVDSVAADVAYAVSVPLRHHTNEARQALRSAMAASDLPSEKAEATVRRFGSDLTVELRPNAELPGPVAEAAAVRAVAGIRRIDPHSGKIDVSVKG